MTSASGAVCEGGLAAYAAPVEAEGRVGALLAGHGERGDGQRRDGGM